MVGELESLGFSVYIWATNEYDALERYNVKRQLKRRGVSHKLTKFIYRLKARLKLDKNKWRQRLMKLNDLPDLNTAEKHLNFHISESIAILLAIKPAYFICWNPYHCRYGIAHDVAEILGIKTRAIEWGYLPDTFILDKGTLASSAIFGINPLDNYSEAAVQAFAKTGKVIFEKLRTSTLSLYQQAKVEIPGDFLVDDKTLTRVLVLGNDEVDSGAYPTDHAERLGLLPFHRSSYHQAEDMAGLDKNYRVIFKPHPSHNKFTTNTRVNANLAIVNGNPDELIDWADVVFSSGSKMEFSVIVKNKPLVNYGAGLLYGKHCAYEITAPELAAAVIGEALKGADNAVHLENFISFIGYLHNEYLYNFVNNGNKAVERMVQ